MSQITETQLKKLANMFSDNPPAVSFFKDYRILVQRYGDEYEYEIEIQDPIYFKWHTWHWTDEGFKSEEEAREAAIKYIDNYDGPGDDYYAQ